MRASSRLPILVALFCGLAGAAEPTPTMAEADSAYAERADITKARMSLEMYQKLIEANPTQAEAYWKASRAAWWVGDQADKPKEKMNFFTLGIELAKNGIRADQSSVESRFWLGANYGSFGETKGVLKSLALVKPIRQEMEIVAKSSPTYQGGAGQRVLGVIDYKVPRFAGGNKDRAEKRLLESFGVDPKNPFNVYYLGEFYSTTKNKEKARQLLASLETLEVEPEHIPELGVLKKKAAQLLSSF